MNKSGDAPAAPAAARGPVPSGAAAGGKTMPTKARPFASEKDKASSHFCSIFLLGTAAPPVQGAAAPGAEKGTQIKAIGAGFSSSVVVTKDGKLFRWGKIDSTGTGW